MSVLRLNTVRHFMFKMNPCNIRPYYAEDCTTCMDEFCSRNHTTREEYCRKKDHLGALQTLIGKLEGEIAVKLREDPSSSIIEWLAIRVNNLEREIEET